MLDAQAVVARVREHALQVPHFSGALVAFSGGLDSSVLLHVLAAGGFAPIRAVYIDHGLQPEVAEQWHSHNKTFCRQLGVPLEVHRVAVETARGASEEAAARDARYAALTQLARCGELVLTAHHESDQAETMLLQLLRGAGPDGLAAMAMLGVLGDRALSRPLLDVSAGHIQAYARAHALRWFDDPSNARQRFDRNFLRMNVLPIMRERWPGLDQTLARSAQWQAQAADLQRQLAAADLRAVCVQDHSQLDCTALSRMSDARRRNVVRFAIRSGALAVPPATRLASLLALIAQSSGRGSVRWDGGMALRYRDTVYLLRELAPEPLAGWHTMLEPQVPSELPFALGRLTLNVDKPCDLALQVRFREGGERIAMSDGGHQSIAKWFQSHGVPPWRRSRTPLVFAGDELVAIGEYLLPAWPLQRVRSALQWAA